MEIETFEVEEVTSDMTGVEDGAHLAMIDRLGLEGQQSFCAGDDGKTLCPYRKMTSEENTVYGTLFPNKVEVEKYRDGLIPIRVLQVLEHAKSLEMFDYIYVWCPKNADDPDPVLVGYIGGSQYSPNEKYILARWGDCLAAFKDLKDKAAVAIRDRYIGQCKKILAELNASLETVGQLSPSEFLSLKGDTGDPWTHNIV